MIFGRKFCPESTNRSASEGEGYGCRELNLGEVEIDLQCLLDEMSTRAGLQIALSDVEHIYFWRQRHCRKVRGSYSTHNALKELYDLLTKALEGFTTTRVSKKYFANECIEDHMSVPKQISSKLMDGEKILYDQPPYMLGLQLSSLKKGCSQEVRGAVFTNKRIIFYKPKIFGIELKDFSWHDIRNINIKEGLLSGEIEFEMVGGLDSEILYMSNDTVQKMYTIVRDLVAKAHESMQQPHAIVQQASTSPHDDSMAKLKQLKEMLDIGLISQSEYDTKKADILSRM